MRFIRVNGRVVPIKDGKVYDDGKKSKKQSEFQKAPIKTGLVKGAKYGAMFGAGAGALLGGSASALLMGSIGKELKMGKLAMTATGIGATALTAGVGAISRGIDGALIGLGVGAAYAGYKKLTKKSKK